MTVEAALTKLSYLLGQPDLTLHTVRQVLKMLLRSSLLILFLVCLVVYVFGRINRFEGYFLLVFNS